MQEFEIQPLAPALPIMDAVAHYMVGIAAPVRFDMAKSPSECEAVYRLRYQVVVEHGWAPPEAFPDGLERDAYDDRAVHIVGWDGAVLAAAARLIFPQPGCLLPTEEAFGIEIEPRGQVVDMGRQIVAHEYSQRQNRIFPGLLGQTWLEMRAHGISYVCGLFSPSMLRLYRILGLQLTVLAPAGRYWGEDRSPARLDVLGSIPALIKRWGAQVAVVGENML
jgi:N-acyl-L-homoserine lactone synthetase